MVRSDLGGKAGTRLSEPSLESRNWLIETRVVAFATGIAEVELGMGPKIVFTINLKAVAWMGAQEGYFEEHFWMKTLNI